MSDTAILTPEYILHAQQQLAGDRSKFDEQTGLLVQTVLIFSPSTRQLAAEYLVQQHSNLVMQELEKHYRNLERRHAQESAKGPAELLVMGRSQPSRKRRSS